LRKIIAAVVFGLAWTPSFAFSYAATISDREREATLERAYLQSMASLDANSPHTQYLIGYGYTVGRNPITGAKAPINYDKGLKLLKFAAENGVPKALTAIGYQYIFGRGVEMSREQAFKYFAMAAAKGDPYGQTELGNSYLKGYGVIQDYLKAYMWLSVSVVPSNNNTSSALKTMEVIKAKISAAELARAVEMARLCAESTFVKCD
jgi:hypothetical protein